jgi:hypothetical protein
LGPTSPLLSGALSGPLSGSRDPASPKDRPFSIGDAALKGALGPVSPPLSPTHNKGANSDSTEASNPGSLECGIKVRHEDAAGSKLRHEEVAEASMPDSPECMIKVCSERRMKKTEVPLLRTS